MSASSRTIAAPRTVSEHGDFRQVVGTTGAILHVLETQADGPTSMKLLSAATLRPLTRQEIIPLLMKDEDLKNALKGKWFYLAGQGLDEDGIFTVDEKGELAEIREKNLSAEQKVRAYSGDQPLSLGVYSDVSASFYGRRFLLGADGGPRDVAPVVVGVPIDREAAAQKSSELRTLIRRTLPQIIAALEPSSNNTVLEGLRRIQKAASE